MKFPDKINTSPFFSSDMFVRAYRIIILFSGILFFYSCSKNTTSELSPIIEIQSGANYIYGDTTISPGSELNFKITAKAMGEKLTNFYIVVIDTNFEKTRVFDTAIYTSDFAWTGSFFKSSEKKERWKFSIRDRNGQETSSSIFIYADTTNAYHSILSINNIILGAQDNSLIGGFYSLDNQMGYFAEEAEAFQDFIDLVFYFESEEDKSTIASPGANIESGIFPENLTPVNWEHRNTTRFIKIPLASNEFDALLNDSIMIARYIDSEGKRKAKNLESPDVYVFKNVQNRLGIFRVNSVTEGSFGEVTIDVKMQEVNK
ncbi:MAG: hypothetical protein K9G76_08915 [Bacteroidales bacterium]|nr:hypothetical protein [Bacteroidales bacterium]MCF8405595.1 hypothetical protein [Bacteroidales bacterium]